MDRPIELAQREYEIDNDPHRYQEKDPVTGITAPRRNEITMTTSTLDPSNIIPGTRNR